MPSELTMALLAQHQAEQRLRQLSRGQLGQVSRQVIAASSELRHRVARLEAAAVAASIRELDPIQAVALVVEAAIAAGADWQQLVATVNRAGTRRNSP